MEAPGESEWTAQMRAHLAELPRGRVVSFVPDAVGQVLLERASSAYGHDLHPAADPQHRETPGLRRVEQRDLPGVAVVAPAPGPWVRIGGVPVRRDVRPAGDDQPVES